MAIHTKSFAISFHDEDQLNQLEAAFKRAGYKWFIPDCRRQSLNSKCTTFLTNRSAYGGDLFDRPTMPFPEGLALLESLAEPVKPTFKVGDRVRIVRKAVDNYLKWPSEMDATISQCGTVTESYAGYTQYVRVETAFGIWNYLPESLELIAEPEAEPQPVATSGTGDSIEAYSGMSWAPISGGSITADYITSDLFNRYESTFSDSLDNDSISETGVKPTSSYGFTQKMIDEITDLLDELQKETSMSETKTPETTIERRIALATGRILWRAAWPVRKLFRGVAKGAVNMFYAALFGGVCYGGYELVQFLQAIKITLPE